jgi:hypothetical protein
MSDIAGKKNGWGVHGGSSGICEHGRPEGSV